MCLTFSADVEEFGVRKEVDLRDGGRAIAVTAENRLQYIYIHMHMHMQIQIHMPA
mgnify:CR=1 FL=1